jgi:hypothetical protein
MENRLSRLVLRELVLLTFFFFFFFLLLSRPEDKPKKHSNPCSRKGGAPHNCELLRRFLVRTLSWRLEKLGGLSSSSSSSGSGCLLPCVSLSSYKTAQQQTQSFFLSACLPACLPACRDFVHSVHEEQAFS